MRHHFHEALPGVYQALSLIPDFYLLRTQFYAVDHGAEENGREYRLCHLVLSAARVMAFPTSSFYPFGLAKRGIT